MSGSVGEFDSHHYQSAGRDILIKGVYSASSEDVKIIVDQLKGNKESKFSFIP